jgi:hypothetical protein
MYLSVTKAEAERLWAAIASAPSASNAVLDEPPIVSFQRPGKPATGRNGQGCVCKVLFLFLGRLSFVTTAGQGPSTRGKEAYASW